MNIHTEINRSSVVFIRWIVTHVGWIVPFALVIVTHEAWPLLLLLFHILGKMSAMLTKAIKDDEFIRKVKESGIVPPSEVMDKLREFIEKNDNK